MALAPGGDDVLVLHHIPILSPHALFAYLSIVAGIAVVLLSMRAISGREMIVRCSGDVCTDQQKIDWKYLAQTLHYINIKEGIMQKYEIIFRTLMRIFYFIQITLGFSQNSHIRLNDGD